MYITVGVLVLFLLFFRKEDFTFYVKNLKPGSVPIGSLYVTGGGDLGSVGLQSGSGTSVPRERAPVGTGLLGPAGHRISV